MPGAGNRAAPPGNPHAAKGPWPITANPLRSHAFCCDSPRDSHLPGSETGKLNLGDPSAARITAVIIACLFGKLGFFTTVETIDQRVTILQTMQNGRPPEGDRPFFAALLLSQTTDVVLVVNHPVRHDRLVVARVGATVVQHVLQGEEQFRIHLEILDPLRELRVVRLEVRLAN